MSRIFWDTNLFVYLIEDFGALSDQVAELRARMLDRRDQLVTSALTLGEVLVKPIEAGRDDLREAYEDALGRSALILPFDRAAARSYGRIRGDRSIRPPDAIQLACASSKTSTCSSPTTTDSSRKSIPGIQFISSLDRVPL